MLRHFKVGARPTLKVSDKLSYDKAPREKPHTKKCMACLSNGLGLVSTH